MNNKCTVLLPVYRFTIADFELITKEKIGNIVQVQVRAKKYFGIITEIKNTTKFKKLNIAEPTCWSVSETYIKFIQQAACYSLACASAFIKTILQMFSNRVKSKVFSYEDPKIKLNEEQQLAFNNVTTPDTYLLFGITGAGKTEVYFSLAHKILQEGGQILILVPEISITEGIFIRFKKLFKEEPSVWSSTTKNKATFMEIISGDSKVIIGARSALLLPFKNLKMIIIDEEHDRSYKQQEYSARDMAVLRGKIENIPVLLASATPSVESYNNFLCGKYKILYLTKRYGERKLPKITNIISSAIISDYAKRRSQEEIEKGGQVIFFLNRRGYSPFVTCKGCFERLVCKVCESGLVWHKKKNMLLCHRCNKKYSDKYCWLCDRDNCLVASGIGVEKIASEVEKIFPEYKIGIVSSDTCSNLEKIKEFIENMKNGHFNIIVGTQILAKGHDFPNISLVVVVNLFNLGYDFRIKETLLQNLIQISGRAGRGDRESEVIIQTEKEFRDAHVLRDNSYEKFLNNEIVDRKKWNFPPFYSICLFKIKDFRILSKIQIDLRNNNIPFYDPIDSISEKRQINIVVKIPKNNFYVIAPILCEISNKYRVPIELDPYDLC